MPIAEAIVIGSKLARGGKGIGTGIKRTVDNAQNYQASKERRKEIQAYNRVKNQGALAKPVAKLVKPQKPETATVAKPIKAVTTRPVNRAAKKPAPITAPKPKTSTPIKKPKKK